MSSVIDGEAREFIAERFSVYVEALCRVCKGRPAGIDPALVRPGFVYVLDWRPEASDRFDAVRAELVDAVEHGTVVTDNGTCDVESYASLVVAGPFPFREEPNG